MDAYLKINHIIKDAEQLEYADFTRLVEVLTKRLKQKTTQTPIVQKKVQLTDLKGLGKRYWQSIDVEKYIDNERDNW